MSSIFDIENLVTYESVEVQGNTALVTFSVPYDVLPTLQRTLNDLAQLSRFVSVKAGHNKSRSGVSEEFAKHNEKKVSERDARVLALFDEARAQGKGLHDSVLQVRDRMNQHEKVINCHMIELILKRTGRVRTRKKSNEDGLIR